MTHSREIQAALAYIEVNLCEPLTLDAIAKAVGFSKFYFHRTFQKEVGLSLSGYIRRRRLAAAAAALLNTNAPILDIALNFHFASQEAFTRAFKRIYQLPPGRYRAAVKDVITGGMDMVHQNEIKAWIITGTAPEKYQTGIDNRIYHLGSRSATIKAIAEAFSAGEFATVMQQFNAKEFIGKRMRFSGFVKAEEVAGWCGLWMRIDSVSGALLKFDNMQGRPITGTSAWNHYACVLDVPKEADIINIGILLCGKGQVWFDDAGFQEVDAATPTTEFLAHDVFPDHPLNLSFEE